MSVATTTAGSLPRTAALLDANAARTFAERWHLRRHPAAPAVVRPDEVHYGPLPRYR